MHSPKRSCINRDPRISSESKKAMAWRNVLPMVGKSSRAASNTVANVWAYCQVYCQTRLVAFDTKLSSVVLDSSAFLIFGVELPWGGL